MPFYDYLCDKGHEVALEQKITEDALTECPYVKCDAPAHRLLSKSSFVLKGGGWSGDGYAKSGKGET